MNDVIGRHRVFQVRHRLRSGGAKACVEEGGLAVSEGLNAGPPLGEDTWRSDEQR